MTSKISKGRIAELARLSRKSRLSKDHIAAITLVAALCGKGGRAWIRDPYNKDVCPVCDAANAVAGQLEWMQGAWSASYEYLGIPEPIVSDIVHAADGVNGPVRDALLEALKAAA